MAAESSSSAPRSGASPDSYIGSLISLTSKSEIRYEGVLYNINTDESSIGLRNVRSFGTEGRKKDGPQVLASDKVYEYILFRGSDIKDLQVKASPPVQSTPQINNDPAIIQSHYPRPPTTSSSLPPVSSAPAVDPNSHPSQLGHPGSASQGALPLYQPGGNLGSWGPSHPPQNASGSGLAMPMYWQGFYGAPNGLPQLPQQSLLRPPPGLSMPPSMPQMQYSAFNSSMPTGGLSLPGSNLPEYPPSLIPNTASLTSSSLPASSLPSSAQPPQPTPALPSNALPLQPAPALPSNVLPLQPAPALPSSVLPLQHLAPSSETVSSNLPNKTSLTAASTATFSSTLPALPPTTTNPGATAVAPHITNIPNPLPGPSQSKIAVGALNSGPVETSTPSLLTPGHLLQSGPATVLPTQSVQTVQKDVEVVQVSPSQSSEPSAVVKSETQPPILPTPQQTHAQRPNGAPFQMRHNNYRGRGGRGTGISRPVTNFTEEFDFMAMNEKFNKDEVWGHLGKISKSDSRDEEGNVNGNDENNYHEEEDAGHPRVEVKPVYNKDDFFDSLSSNAMDNASNQVRPRFSEQRKIDAETFGGEYARYRGGRGRGPYRGGRSRGYYGGYGGRGYGYGGRGRGRGSSD
nr:protein decapping 5 [Ipomoea batatas]